MNCTYVIMSKLHKSENENLNIVSEEEQRQLLCSNNSSQRCSFLDTVSSEESINDSLRELAAILVEGYLDLIKNETPKF
jgi:hypothetical protein